MIRLIASTFLIVLAAVSAQAAPMSVHSWQLHDSAWSNIEATLQRAPEFGVNEVQLSHGIITTVDQLVDEPATLALVQRIIDFCTPLNIGVTIWAKELNIGTMQINTDLDPEGGGREMWARRRAAYARAFELCPGLSGVVLQFGSCPTEPWAISDGASAFNAATPCPERIKLIVGIVQEVCSAHGKRVDVRDFNHSVAQQACMQDAFRSATGFRAMLKEVPQDWQPYYPLNPMIGDVGPNESVVEFDLGAEYWGLSKVPFVLVDYLSERMRALDQRRAMGVVARIERGSNRALGTPNEINLYAMSRLVRDPQLTPDRIFHDWMAQRYQLDPAGKAAAALTLALRESFDVGRKLFYVRNHWALEKGSQIPEKVAADCLYLKALPQWDPDYKKDWQRMTAPDVPLLAEIWQEKSEAIEIAARARERIEGLRDALAPADFASLSQQFSDLATYTRIWQHVADAVFRASMWRKSGEDHAILLGHAEALEAIAEEHPALELAPKKRLHAFAADVRKKVKGAPAPAQPNVATITGISTSIGEGVAVVRWVSAATGPGRVLWGRKLPHLDQVVAAEREGEGHYVARIVALPAGEISHFRIAVGDLHSGDFLLQLP